MKGASPGALFWLLRNGSLSGGMPSWSYLPPEGRDVFLAEYGPVGAEQLLRARVVALSLSAALAHYGHQEGFRAVEREALSGLVRAAAA